MRQRLHRFLPIFLFALTVQVYAPIANSWAAGIAISDPLASGEICRHNADSQTGGTSGDERLGHLGCLTCCLAHAVATADAPRGISVLTVARRSERLIWTDLPVSLHTSNYRLSTQARAPPLLS